MYHRFVVARDNPDDVDSPAPGARAARPGWVYLVGAGPGDPALITLRGSELLGSADLVLHDELLEAPVGERVALGHVKVNIGSQDRGAQVARGDRAAGVAVHHDHVVRLDNALAHHLNQPGKRNPGGWFDRDTVMSCQNTNRIKGFFIGSGNKVRRRRRSAESPQ